MELDLAGLPSWYRQAACLGVPQTLGADPWFPEGQGASPAEAIAVCNVCPVREPCADHALEHRMREGVWGGLSAATSSTPSVLAAVRSTGRGPERLCAVLSRHRSGG